MYLSVPLPHAMERQISKYFSHLFQDPGVNSYCCCIYKLNVRAFMCAHTSAVKVRSHSIRDSTNTVCVNGPINIW